MPSIHKLLIVIALTAIASNALAHYPLLDCQFLEDAETKKEIVKCEAGFSDRSKAPNVLMEVFSEDDEVLSKGHTDDSAMYQFDRPDGAFFVIMDAGPGHVLEISDEDIVE
jgi:hypothetical protein